MEDTLQPTIDLILNMSMFIWLGAVCPWSAFTDSSIVPLPRLILLAILILALRRLPVILSLRPWVRHIHTTRDALFMGFFGPIGVSAIFYYCLCIEYLATFQGGEAMAGLAASMRVVVWFLIMTSVLVHGLSIPLAMLGRSLFDLFRPPKRETQPLLIE
jgi:NhaP-type Na+/H+ or K+/H+ antiporter